MKKVYFLAALLLIFSCKEKSTQQETTATPVKEEGWTKPMMISVDAPTTYFDDVDDEDFSEYSTLIYDVLQQVHEGKLVAYDYMEGRALTAEEAKNKTVLVDTVFVDNPNPPFNTETKIVTTDITQKIVSVKVKETWRYNKQAMLLEKKVLGIAPRVPIYNSQTGELRGYTPLFWVFFDKQAEQDFINKNKSNS